MAEQSIAKVVAYVVSKARLLVFVHPLHPDAGLQVPAGTVVPGETFKAAVLRELHEETGLDRFGEPEYLGTSLFDMAPFGRAEMHRRHFFRVPLLQEAPDRWRHFETSGGTEAPELFEFRWVPLEAVPPLAADQGSFIESLRTAA